MRELTKKAERVGNFRLFRTFAPCGAKERIDAIKVTNLEGSWGVVIPMTFGMYAIIAKLFESELEDDEKILNTIFCNWYAVTSIGDGEFHHDLLKAQENLLNRIGRDENETDEEDVLKKGEMAEEARAILAEEDKKAAEPLDPAAQN